MADILAKCGARNLVSNVGILIISDLLDRFAFLDKYLHMCMLSDFVQRCL